MNEQKHSMQKKSENWMKSFEFFAWNGSPKVHACVDKRTRRLMLWASIFCVSGAFNSLTLISWFGVMLGLFASPFFGDQKREWISKRTDIFMWPVLLASLYALTKLSPDNAKSFSVFAAVMLLQSNVRLKTSQDAGAIVAPFFCTLAFGFISSESLATSAPSIAGSLLLLMGLSSANDSDPKQKTGKHFWRVAKVGMMSIPWIVALFFLFPRIPFSPLPQQSDEQTSGSTGLSDSMMPGSISELVQSNKPAFLAAFNNRVPDQKNLYWRATVFDQFDGKKWTSTIDNSMSLTAKNKTKSFDHRPFAFTKYSINFASSFVRFLPIPDGTIDGGILLALRGGASVKLSSNPVGVYQMPSTGLAITNVSGIMEVEHDGSTDQKNEINANIFLQLPKGLNPRTQSLAKRIAIEFNSDPDEIANAFKKRIKEGNYWYTLKPPMLSENGVDQFLFESQKGFCEHYSSAFVIFMRMAGVPARVVTGYQGGYANQEKNTVEVLSRDAHAWAEILSNGKWVRIDPTTFIDPTRVEPEASQPGAWTMFGEWGKDMQRLMAKMNTQWNEKIVSYDAEVQDGMLEKIGVPEKLRHLFSLVVFMALGILFFIISFLRKEISIKKTGTKSQRIFRKLRKNLKNQGFPIDDHTTGTQAIKMVQERLDKKTIDQTIGGNLLQEINTYIQEKYGK